MDYKMHIFYMCVEPLAIKSNTISSAKRIDIKLEISFV